jgi:hypothetical protein
MSNQSDIQEEWERKSDIYYYGEIPKDVTRQQLIEIITRGLHNMIIDEQNAPDEEKNNTDYTTLANIIAGWFEHNSELDILVSDDDFDDFCDDVILKFREIQI